jgi:Reverse transcriptase (RNA-dependent DNA polymerase)/gag-polypeptide of LTR copia-type
MSADDNKLTSSGYAVNNIPLLAKDNWAEWDKTANFYLVLNYYDDLIDADPPAQIEDETAERFEKRKAKWIIRTLRAVTALRTRLDTGAYDLVEGEDMTVKTLLSTIKKNYAATGTGELFDLIIQFWHLQLSDFKNIEEYAAEFLLINKKLVNIDATAKLNDLHIVLKFLDGLDSSYRDFRQNIRRNEHLIKTGEHEPLTFQHVVSLARTEERGIRREDEQGVAMVAAKGQADKGRGGKPWCTRCEYSGHTLDTCFLEHPEKAPKGWKPRGKGGRNNNKRKRAKGSNDKKSTESKDSKDSKDSKESKDSDSDSDTDTGSIRRQIKKRKQAKVAIGHIRAELAMLSAAEVRDGAILDTGCSQHASGSKDRFFNLRPAKNSDSLSGIGDKEMRAAGVGSIRLPGPGTELVLNDVLYIPGIGCNLISVGQLEAGGVKIGWGAGKGKGEGLNFTVGGVKHTTTRNGLIYLMDSFDGPNDKTTIPTGPAQAREASKDIQMNIARPAFTIDRNLLLWHERMGHLGAANVKKLSKMSKGIDLLADYCSDDQYCVCEFCIRGRMTKLPYNRSTKPGTTRCELLWFDMVGPIQTAKTGERYFAHILDDYSKMGSVKCFKTKGECFEYFKAWQKENEREGERIRRVRIDGGELASAKRFQDYCYNTGIRIELVVPYNPSENGGAERHGQTLWNKTESTIRSADLPLIYWTEVLRAVNYLTNVSPHSKINMTPMEKWTGHQPDISHIRKLGSDAWNLIGTKTKKLEDKALKGKLIGFEGESLYRILLPNGNIVRGKNVHIVEKKPAAAIADPPKPSEPSTTVQSEPDATRNLRLVNKRIRDVEEGEISSSVTKKLRSRERATRESTPQDGMDLDPPRPPSPISESDRPNSPVSTPSRPNTPTPPSTPSTARPSRPVTPDTYMAHFNEIKESHPMLKPLSPMAESPDPLALLAFVARKPTDDVIEPKTLKQARKGGQWDLWALAAEEEYCSLEENGTWTLVDAPKDRKVLRGKWVFKLKRGANGEVIRHKARWVVRGFEQKEGTDYFETFASVVKPMSYKAIFALAAAEDWELEQMDVKTAFLYGEVEEEVFVQQPVGMEDPKHPDRVCKLFKALYGLKQAPRVWYRTICNFLKKHGYQPLDSDASVFFGHDTIIAIYVDDILIAGPNMQKIKQLKKQLSDQFKMTDMGPCSFYLGMKIERDRKNRTLTLSQHAYLQNVMERFNMDNSSPKATPMDTGAAKVMIPAPDGYEAPPALRKEYQSMVGSLMYAMLGTRPDIAYAVSVVSRYSSNPTETHMKAVKRILRYLNATKHLKLVFSGTLTNLTGFTDADWAGDHGTRRSTSGYLFHVGSGVISWSSKRQATVSLSSCESEYVGQTQAAKEAIWLKRFLSQISPGNFANSIPTVIWCDNQGAIALAKNPANHARTKHIDINHHWQREVIEAGDVEMKYISTQSQVADGLTKPLSRDRFEAFRESIGVY